MTRPTCIRAAGRESYLLGKRGIGELVHSRAFDMFQFWQNRQPRLHPAVPNESTLVPGRMIQRFSSIGSTQTRCFGHCR